VNCSYFDLAAQKTTEFEKIYLKDIEKKINAIQDPNKMKPPKRLRNPPKKRLKKKSTPKG